jgi:hypothetical protein
MKSRATTHKMCIIHRWNNTDDTSTPCIHMAEIVTQSLDIVNREFIFIDQDSIMCWTRGSLQTRMGKQVKVVELRMSDIGIDDGSSGAIASTVGIATFGREETSMMTFGNDDESDVGTITLLESFAGRTDGFDFSFDDVSELSFGDTIAEEQDAFRLRFGLLIEGLLSDQEGEGEP